MALPLSARRCICRSCNGDQQAAGTLGPSAMVLFDLVLTVSKRLRPSFHCYAVSAPSSASAGALRLTAFVPILVTLVLR